jgi:hypothetical protein
MKAFINTLTNEYPLHIGDLQQIDVNYSLGQELPKNIAELIYEQQPDLGNYWEHYLSQNEPQLIDGQWKVTWTVNDYAPGEYVEKNINNPNAHLPFGPWNWDATGNIWYLASPLAKATE